MESKMVSPLFLTLAGVVVIFLCCNDGSLKAQVAEAAADTAAADSCLKCICKAESGCRPLGCHMDGGSLSCGYFQAYNYDDSA